MRETRFRYLPCFPINRKRPAHWLVFAGRVNGRDDRIRTCGLIVPNDARYQTVPHPDNDMYSINFPAKKQVFIFNAHHNRRILLFCMHLSARRNHCDANIGGSKWVPLSIELLICSEKGCAISSRCHRHRILCGAYPYSSHSTYVAVSMIGNRMGLRNYSSQKLSPVYVLTDKCLPSVRNTIAPSLLVCRIRAPISSYLSRTTGRG